VHWWNNIRLHSTLNYKTPAQVRNQHVKKTPLIFLSSLLLTFQIFILPERMV
ncbi:IS3 family transposase, partial [Lactococcus garvieae]|uniref:IS3 family transposase n=1 Tax=Lactococcus garvieae TaxID=1363 RepID=UPI003D72AD7A